MFIFERPLYAVAAGLAVALLTVGLDRGCQPDTVAKEVPSAAVATEVERPAFTHQAGQSAHAASKTTTGG